MPYREPIRVVLVDKHRMIVETLARLLITDPEITVVDTANSAAEAIVVVRTVRPDIVVMDFRLPDMDGAGATRILKTVEPAVKVIMLTISDQPDDQAAATRAGVSAWVPKTDTLAELIDVVHRVFAGEAIPAETRPTSTRAVQRPQSIRHHSRIRRYTGDQ